jgi:hypothetical protein
VDDTHPDTPAEQETHREIPQLEKRVAWAIEGAKKVVRGERVYVGTWVRLLTKYLANSERHHINLGALEGEAKALIETLPEIEVTNCRRKAEKSATAGKPEDAHWWQNEAQKRARFWSEIARKADI